MTISKVILSHPYSGSLYAYFREQETKRPSEEILSHPYYRTLYGKNFRKYTDFVLTLSLLYPNIILPPADAHLPSIHKYRGSGQDGYYNPDLGLITSWEDRGEINVEIHEKVERDLNDKVILKILQKVPRFSKEQILLDTHVDMYLASKYQCPIICSGGRKQIITRLVELDDMDTDVVRSSSIEMLQEYMKISGLLFDPKNIEVLYALKADKEIKEYAEGFVKIMHGFSGSQDTRKQLLILIREAMNKAIIANNISGVFDVISNFLGIIGIGATNPIVSVADLTADGISQIAQKRSIKQEWFQFGPEVKKFLSLAEFDLAIEKELKELDNK